ncbi:MAG: hypothetical protein C0391_00135 [Anaerolinea sp.]|nr:hypothetical protein [Anaerolinea sp.]
MTTTDLDPPVWVETPNELNSMCACLESVCCIAVDTESNSLHAYKEQVCLIQFSISNQDFLVDTLALHDISRLAPIFDNPNIVKIFHAAEYDLLCLKRDYHIHIQNVFDTMLAARILGYPVFGLGAILKDKFGVEMDKRYQKADWAKRPMPAAMLSYARMDTHYLVALREIMLQELNERHLMELAEEDFQRIAKVNGNGQEPDLNSFWKVNGAHDLNPIQAAVLRALYHVRDHEARRRNIPPFKVCPNEFLLALATTKPQNLEELLATGLNERLLKRYSHEWLTAVKVGLESEGLRPPRAKKRDVLLKERIDALKEWRKKTAAELNVESDVILPKDLMIAIAEKKPATFEQLAEIMAYFPWRYTNYGSQIIKVMQSTK